jgi:lysophospholipase L1-like esterase
MTQGKEAGSKRVRLVQNVLLAASSTVFFLAALEGGARLAGQRPCLNPTSQAEGAETKIRSHPLRQYELVPGSTFTFEREAAIRHNLSPDYLDTWERITYRINSLGLRGPEASGPKSADTVRVLVLGDSVAFGWGIEEEDSLVYQLQRHLNRSERGTQFEVWNAGVPGYATWHELQYLVEKEETFEPDVILVTFMFNDVDGNNEAVHEQPLGMGALARTFALLNRRSALLCFVRNTALRLKLQQSQACQGPNCWDETEKLLDGLVEESHKLGSAIALVAFPMRRQVEPDAEPSYYDRALGENPKEGYQDVVARLCHKRGIAYLDLLPAFQEATTQGQRSLFLDFEHPNSQGHHVAAEAMSPFLAILQPITETSRYNHSQALTYSDGVRK